MPTKIKVFEDTARDQIEREVNAFCAEHPVLPDDVRYAVTAVHWDSDQMLQPVFTVCVVYDEVEGK